MANRNALQAIGALKIKRFFYFFTVRFCAERGYATVMACPHQLPKTATNCCQKQQQIVAVSGNNLLPGVDRP